MIIYNMEDRTIELLHMVIETFKLEYDLDLQCFYNKERDACLKMLPHKDPENSDLTRIHTAYLKLIADQEGSISTRNCEGIFDEFVKLLSKSMESWDIPECASCMVKSLYESKFDTMKHMLQYALGALDMFRNFVQDETSQLICHIEDNQNEGQTSPIGIVMKSHDGSKHGVVHNNIGNGSQPVSKPAEEMPNVCKDVNHLKTTVTETDVKEICDLEVKLGEYEKGLVILEQTMKGEMTDIPEEDLSNLPQCIIQLKQQLDIIVKDTTQMKATIENHAVQKSKIGRGCSELPNQIDLEKPLTMVSELKPRLDRQENEESEVDGGKGPFESEEKSEMLQQQIKVLQRHLKKSETSWNQLQNVLQWYTKENSRDHMDDCVNAVKELLSQLTKLEGENKYLNEYTAERRCVWEQLRKALKGELTGEDCSAETHKCVKRVIALKNELQEIEETNSELQSRIKADQEGWTCLGMILRGQPTGEWGQDSKAQLDPVKELKERLEEEVRSSKFDLDECRKQLAEQVKTTKRMEMELKQQQASIEEYTQRLSAEMSKKIASDESSLENINIRDRPMNIATDFEHLCSNQWLAAKTELDDRVPTLDNDARLIRLAKIIKVASEVATEAYENFSSRISDLLRNPLADKSMEESEEIPADMVNHIGDFLRRKSGIDLKILLETTKERLTAEPGFEDIIQREAMIPYMEECVSIAWKMAIQRPPMTFKEEGIGEPFQGDNRQNLFWNSSDPKEPGSKVSFYVHPALYHADAMMVKGRVMLKIEDEIEDEHK